MINKKSLSSLQAVSEQLAISRNNLVAYAIQRLLPILLDEQRQQKKRENALSKITAHFCRSVELLNEIERTVGKKDTLCEHLAAVMDTYRRAFTKISDVVEKGKRVSSIKITEFNEES